MAEDDTLDVAVEPVGAPPKPEPAPVVGPDPEDEEDGHCPVCGLRRGPHGHV